MNSQTSRIQLKLKKNYNYQKYFAKSINVHICPDIDYSIVNVIISKKIIKSSVERNKYKRRLREVIRSFYHNDLLGRQVVIYVTKNIIGLDKEESDKILNKIFEHQARLELTCRFTWTENTVCIWDNRSVIHFAIADFYPGRSLGYERIMDRIAIEGDVPA